MLEFARETFHTIASIIFATFVGLLQPTQMITPQSTVQAQISHDVLYESTQSAVSNFESNQPLIDESEILTEQSFPFVEAEPSNQENYQLTPHPNGEEGFYIMKHAPKEQMTSVEELNQALNHYREAHGLASLYIDPQICDIAAQRAAEAHEDFSQPV